MNDFVVMLGTEPEEPTTLLDRALLLAEVPCSPIDMENPRRATLALFNEGRAPSPLRVVR